MLAINFAVVVVVVVVVLLLLLVLVLLFLLLVLLVLLLRVFRLAKSDSYSLALDTLGIWSSRGY